MTAALVSRWARRYVLASAAFLVAWQLAALVGVSRTAEVLLGVFGFVLHMVFGKAYSLVPSYFERELAVPRAPALQFPLVVVGAAALAVGVLPGVPSWVGALGSLLWALGVAVFLGVLGWTIRGNLTGRETATGRTNAARRPVDRAANAFVPVALGYLAVGSAELVALHAGLPVPLGGSVPRVAHLLAAGTAALLVFALGFRLLPRFLVARPPRALVAVVLPAGALGPALLATHLWDGVWFRLGALVEAAAVVGFAAAYAVLFARSERRRVGFYGVLAGAASGVVGVGLGLSFAFGHATPALLLAHARVNVLGFLGLTVVGVAYQFYPPAVGTLPGASDRAAIASIAAVAGGLLIQVGGLAGGGAVAVTVGRLATLAGALLYAYLLVAVFRAR